MNFKWFQNKLTFVMIPEANESVIRVKLSRGTLWGTTAAVVLLVVTASWIYLHHLHAAASMYMQKAALHGKTIALEQDLQNKNAAIEQLHNDIFALSKQAAEIHHKMEEMKRLEQDLQKLAADAAGSGGAAVTSAEPGADSSAAYHGLGGRNGPYLPLKSGSLQAPPELPIQRCKRRWISCIPVFPIRSSCCRQSWNTRGARPTYGLRFREL